MQQTALSAVTAHRCYCYYYFPQPQRDDEGNTIKASEDARSGLCHEKRPIGKCRDTSLPQPNSSEEQTTGDVLRQVIEEK